MTPRRLLLVLTLAMPLLLGWIVVLGELNQALDRSPAVHARMFADRVDETPFTAPMLSLRDTLLDSQPVSSGFRAGEDVFFRFVMKEGRWVFDRARKKTSAQNWSASAIDIPARVFIENATAGLQAQPLLPRRFAISRRTMTRLRQQTLVDVILRRGAFGTVWISEAIESELPLGNVVAILSPPQGTSVVVVGEVTQVVARSYGSRSGAGWMAAIEGDQVGMATPIDGRPLDAIHLPSGIAVAVQTSVQMNRFDVRVGEKLTSYEGTFLSFEPDGSFWSLRPDPFPSGRQQKLIKRNLDGTVMHEVMPGENVVAASGDTVIATIGYEVRRSVIDASRLVLSDAWTIEGLAATCMSAPNLIAAVGREGLFILTPGDKSPKKVLEKDGDFSPTNLECDRHENFLVILTKPEPSYRAPATARLLFRSADGSQVQLGEHALPAEMGSGSRLLRIGDRLYFGWNGEIFIFDLKSARLLRRISGRRIEEKRRVF